MHTNWCVLVEISMVIGMWNFWSVINGHCTDGKNITLYRKYTWIVTFLDETIILLLPVDLIARFECGIYGKQGLHAIHWISWEAGIIFKNILIIFLTQNMTAKVKEIIMRKKVLKIRNTISVWTRQCRWLPDSIILTSFSLALHYNIKTQGVEIGINPEKFVSEGFPFSRFSRSKNSSYMFNCVV